MYSVVLVNIEAMLLYWDVLFARYFSYNDVSHNLIGTTYVWM
jgi:hypothetical protein